jgi:hypothetical protein
MSKTYIEIKRNSHESVIYRFTNEQEKEKFLNNWYWQKDPLRIHDYLSKFLYFCLLPFELVILALKTTGVCLSKIAGLLWIINNTIKDNHVTPEQTKID